MRLKLEWLGVFLTLGLTMGCATLRGMGAKHEHIEKQTKDYVYNQPATAVWPAARQLLFEKGFEVKNTGEAGMLTAESEWKYEGKKRTRYLAQATPVGDTQCRIVFTKMESDKDGSDTTRDLALEWELIQKVEPDRAAQIKTEAEQKGEAAKNAP
jgi:pyruvate/2-oxoglutarate dehydrogenase complex dihydrolipoamide acyltransferase (E2) component